VPNPPPETKKSQVKNNKCYEIYILTNVKAKAKRDNSQARVDKVEMEMDIKTSQKTFDGTNSLTLSSSENGHKSQRLSSIFESF
jgi:hypothetical protein